MDPAIYGPNYQRVRLEALQRSGGICQLCGWEKAEHTHHWAGTPFAGRYPLDGDVTADDLTALCKPCHDLAHAVRDHKSRCRTAVALPRIKQPPDDEALTDIELRVKALIWSSAPISGAEIMRQTGLPRSAVLHILKKLHGFGHITEA